MPSRPAAAATPAVPAGATGLASGATGLASGGLPKGTEPPDPYADDELSSPWPRRWLVVAIFVVAEIVMVRRTPDQLAHRLLGNLSDPALIIWTLRWDGHAMLHQLWSSHPLGIFNANIYWPYPHTLAYADDLISIAPIYNALFAVTRNWTLSLNLLWLGELGLNMGATYSLTRWLIHRTEAAVFAGLACGFSAFVLSQTGHPQLQVVGLIPLGLLLLFKLLDRPSVGLGVGFGVVNLVILLAAQYWAAIYALSVVVVLVGWLIVTRGRLRGRLLLGLAVGGVITLIAAPTFIPYHDVEASQPKRALAPYWSLHARDVVRPAAGSYLYGALGNDHVQATTERHDFPGLSTMALAAVGIAALILAARRARAERRAADADTDADTAPAHPRPRIWAPVVIVRPPPLSERRTFIVFVAAVGLLTLVLAIGVPVGWAWTPWRFFYDHVPGFSGIRVTARLAAVSLLALAVLAGVGLDSIVHWLRRPWLQVGVTALACVVVLVELAAPLPWVTLPSDPATLAVYHALSHLPAGAVVELPMTDPAVNGPRWSHTEPPRMVWATIDWHPRLNGYSGYESPTYSADAELMATLPDAAAFARLFQLRVRYLILHVGVQTGYAMYTEAQAQAIVSGLPPGASVSRYGPNYLVDLGAA